LRLYLDSNAIIYSVEGIQSFRDSALSWIERASHTPEGRVLTSRISHLECRSKPLGEGNQDLLARYDTFLATLTTSAVTDEVVEVATQLRARFKVRSVDAVHLATAIVDGSDIFLTGDQRLERCTDVNVVVLQP
jgi:predicted nucleic acid-binding protein